MHREPEWNAENINKKCGDTTFKFCGWCKYRGTGSYRYDCMIVGKCDLLKSYNNEVFFDTECVIKKLGKKDLESIIESKNYEIENHEKSIEQLKKQISVLNSLDNDNVPPLPNNRRYNHFNIDDEIMCFVMERGKWMAGKVVSGYRHHDGCVSMYIYEKHHDGDYLNGHGRSGGIAIPHIMLKSEYDWFVKNPDSFIYWINKACENKFNGEKLDPSMFVIPS